MWAISSSNFRQKLNDTRFNYHFFTSIWNRPNTGFGQFNYFIDAVLSRFEVKFIYFWDGKNKIFGNKSCKIRHMILFVFHFPAIWLVALNKSGNLILCFIFNVASSLAGNKVWFKAKNSAIRKQIAPIRANQITGTTSDFKMGVIKCGKWLIAAIVLQRFASHLNFCLENDCKWNVSFFLFLFIFINNIHGKLLTSDWLR